MREFFKPWRRKIGVVTLLMAWLFAAGWVRSLSLYEVLEFPNREPYDRYVVGLSCDSKIGILTSSPLSAPTGKVVLSLHLHSERYAETWEGFPKKFDLERTSEQFGFVYGQTTTLDRGHKLLDPTLSGPLLVYGRPADASLSMASAQQAAKKTQNQPDNI